MRANLPFDDFVKQQFNDHSPDVPGHIWKNIIDKRRSRPKGFWVSMLSGRNILILSAILLAGGGISYVLLSNGNSPSTKNIAAEKNNSSQPVNTSTDKPEKNSTATATSTSPDVNDPSAQQQQSEAVIPDEQSPGLGNRSNSHSFIPVPRKKEIKNSVYKNTSNESGDQEGQVITSQDETSSSIVYSPFRFNNARELTNTKTIRPINIKLPDCPAIEKNAAGNKKYWEVYAGPDHAFESYKSYGDTASANYLEKRKASTKFASAFSVGARYTKVFNNGTSVRAGINYSQVNEKFLYFNPNEIKYVTVITTRVVIRAPGDTVYINDTLQYQQTGTRIKTTYNRYRNIDVPLVIGYELGNGRIHANINAGVIINIYSWYKGDVLDSLSQPVTITTGKGNSIYQFKNNIGVGFLGSVSVYYKITDKLHLVLEPYFRYNLSPMSKENLNLQQKYNVAGLRAGIRFDLK